MLYMKTSATLGIYSMLYYSVNDLFRFYVRAASISDSNSDEQSWLCLKDLRKPVNFRLESVMIVETQCLI
jgi:hypothetical protein